MRFTRNASVFFYGLVGMTLALTIGGFLIRFIMKEPDLALAFWMGALTMAALTVADFLLSRHTAKQQDPPPGDDSAGGGGSPDDQPRDD